MKKYYRKVQLILAALLFLVGLSAVAGSYGLIFMDGMGIPLSEISGTFSSFLIPALILGFVVGGTHLAASCSLVKNHKFAPEATATAGFGLLIWVFVEMYIIPIEAHWLQAAYFTIGIITLIVTMGLYKYKHLKT